MNEQFIQKQCAEVGLCKGYQFVQELTFEQLQGELDAASE